MTETDLDRLDAEISRCIDCADWRWRASYLPCQQCGAPSLAQRLLPVTDLDSDEITRRWRTATLVWAGEGLRVPKRRRAKVA